MRHCYKSEMLWFSYHSRFFKSASKPKEKSRSASSTTSISSDECRTTFWALRCASTRDGVPTTTSGFSIRMGLFKNDMFSVMVRDKRQCWIFIQCQDELTSALTSQPFQRCRPPWCLLSSMPLTVWSWSGPVGPALWLVPEPEPWHSVRKHSGDIRNKGSGQEGKKEGKSLVISRCQRHKGNNKLMWQGKLLAIKIAQICIVLTCLEERMRCMTGIAYAAVFPDPVLARARRSFPSKAKGIAFSWIRVGWDQPRSATAWKKESQKHLEAIIKQDNLL